MKQSLQLRLGQQLTMTPQLQQAIRLLQLSTLELQTEVQQALESNPMLEMEDDDLPDGAAAAPAGARTDADPEPVQTPTDIPEELPVDSAWEDLYDGGLTYGAARGDDDDRDFEYSRDPVAGSLHEHLQWQAGLTPLSDTDQAIALAIIDSVNEDGYLGATAEEICECLASEVEVEPDEVEAVLHRIQNFDPPGVAARSLGECLLIQLRQLPEDTEWRDQAMRLVSEHIDLLASRDTAQILRRMKIESDDLQAILGLIRTLNPHPGRQAGDLETDYVVPDVIVRKHKGAWRVELNPDTLPKVRINPQYAGMVRRADSSQANTYLRNQLQEARWFLKSLQSRSETLLKVATAIVERQRGFLEHGEVAMKPLVLRDVADSVSMHESTISRVTTQKFMHTPRGIFEFKYFFSSHVSTSDGGECSATAIRALIKQLVAAENPAKPLSDSKLADILTDQGIQVARRTVAKYREALTIPPSNERKQLL